MRMLGLVALVTVCLVQDPTFVVEAIVVSGAKRLSTEQVVQLSGVAAGAGVRIADLEAAAKRLAGTGLFANVAYKYATANGRITATFEIVEAEWTMPVGFDNFIWISDEDLLAEVRKKVPSFDGMSPNNGEAITYITGVLQDVLKARGLPGTVEHLPFLNTKTRAQMHLYKAARPSPMICAVRVTGASAKWDRALGEITAPMIGTEYSRNYLVDMSGGTLVDLFRSQGHWAAQIATPEASLSGACSGVSVTVPVTEGPPFAWERPEWTGNVLLPAADLATALDLRPGDVADASKLALGIRRLREAYATKGHLMATVTYRPTLMGNNRVLLNMSVVEGPQFHMGTLEVLGLPQSDTSNLAKRWRLKQGDVYDASYTAKFWIDEVRPMLKRLNLRAAAPDIRADRERLTVTVRIAALR